MPHPANDLRIEKGRISVSLTLMSGAHLTGDMYVQASEHHAGAMEDAPEVLNGADPYFPLALDGGGAILVAKDNVRTLATARADVHEDDAPGIATHVEVWLRDGERVTGSFVVEQIDGRSRILDYLNRRRDRFLPLCGGETILLINRTLIERVRSLATLA